MHSIRRLVRFSGQTLHLPTKKKFVMRRYQSEFRSSGNTNGIRLRTHSSCIQIHQPFECYRSLHYLLQRRSPIRKTVVRELCHTGSKKRFSWGPIASIRYDLEAQAEYIVVTMVDRFLKICRISMTASIYVLAPPRDENFMLSNIIQVA